ncbi:MAG: hypothetical protein IKK09_01000 [Clostridia bacterium]|nr:hypothetical protein [Clostridia bacterium]
MLKIFIGYLFIFIDFDIGGFDIASDFIGFILIYLGINEYPDVVSFRKSTPFMLAMLVKSLVFTILAVFFKEDNTTLSLISAALIIPSAIVSLCYLYYIIKGFGELEEKTGLDLNYQKLFGLWNKRKFVEILDAVFIVITSVFAILNLTPDKINSYDTELITLVSAVISVISVVFVIMLLVIEIKQLIYIYKAKQALDTYQPDEAVLQDYEQPTEE